MQKCHGCEGKGWVDSARFGPIVCPICKGTGQIANGSPTPTLKYIESERNPGPTVHMKQSSLRCLISLKGGQDKLVQIPRATPKVERENAWAITNGYRKSAGLYYVSIFTALEDAVILKNGFTERDRFIPQLLSYRTSQEEQYPVSKWGLLMGVSDYTHPFLLLHRYVAILDRIFYIKKEFHDDRGMELWEVLCNNGIFDIWEPVAPYHRLTGHFDLERGGKKNIMRPQILLLRVFELDRTLGVEHRKTHTDLVVSSGDGTPLTLKKPVIPYDVNDRFYHGFRGKYTFVDVGDRIEETLENFDALRDEEIVNDTSRIEIPIAAHHQNQLSC